MFSPRLGYPAWLVFLRYLAETKHLVLHQVWAALEQVKCCPPLILNSVLCTFTKIPRELGLCQTREYHVIPLFSKRETLNLGHCFLYFVEYLASAKFHSDFFIKSKDFFLNCLVFTLAY